jgi:hypothetical protein
MVSSTRARRAVAAAVVAAAVASVGAASAEAKTVTVTDDTAAEFAQGTPGDGTVVRAPGSVEIAPAMEEPFDGTSLPAGWTLTQWPGSGAATVAGGLLGLDGFQVVNGTPGGPGSSLQFTADFGNLTNRHAGFATDLNNPPWAIFSTGGSNPPTTPTNLYARTSDGAGPMADMETPLPLPSGPKTYRIDWTATGFVFFIEGNEVASHPIPLTNPMSAAASDYDADGQKLEIDSAALRTRTTGTFTSRPLDAGDGRVTGLSLAGTGDGTIAYETRTADTPGGFADDWLPVTGGAVASPARRYLQYRATLTTSNPGVTPRLDKVDVGFIVDDEAPKVTIQDVAVSGSGAKATFSSDDAAAKLECSLDGAVFATCASPAEFSGLAVGSHKFDVRATDDVGNVGTATRSFLIAAPPANPPATPVNPSGDVPDRTKPKVLVLGSSLRVNKSGVAKLRIRCPRSEKSCKLAVKLKLRGKRIASKSKTLSSGATGTFRLKLSSSARIKLAAR